MIVGLVWILGISGAYADECPVVSGGVVCEDLVFPWSGLPVTGFEIDAACPADYDSGAGQLGVVSAAHVPSVDAALAAGRPAWVQVTPSGRMWMATSADQLEAEYSADFYAVAGGSAVWFTDLSYVLNTGPSLINLGPRDECYTMTSSMDPGLIEVQVSGLLRTTCGDNETRAFAELVSPPAQICWVDL